MRQCNSLSKTAGRSDFYLLCSYAQGNAGTVQIELRSEHPQYMVSKSKHISQPKICSVPLL